MSRGQLSKAALSEISKKVPDLTNFWHRVRPLNVEFISINFEPKSDVPIAAVCLNDTLSAVGEATYALRESYAHDFWYHEQSKKPSTHTGVYFARFYSDDVALRLYAASEHLANSLISMLSISKENLLNYKKKQSSQASIVGHYLTEQYPSHPLTQLIKKLITSEEWLKTIGYRNEWVHHQPPLIAGLGIQHSRKSRWEKIISNGIVTGHKLSYGGGDKPEYTVKELQNIVSVALFTFLEVFDQVIEFYYKVLENNRITFE